MFADFCKSFTDGSMLEDPIFDTDENTTQLPSQYEKPVNVLIKNMKVKKDIFDKVNIPYIEGAFSEDYVSILEEKLDDGEIPDGIIVTLSFGIYGKNFNKLSDDERTIIKVLSVYICIQN